MKRSSWLAGAVLLGACAREAPRPEPASHSLAGQRCLDCHGDLVRSYRATGMARAAGPIEGNEVERLAAVTDGAGWTYRFERGDSVWRIAESYGVEHGMRAGLVFAIGAGKLDRAYAARVGSLMVLAPLEVVSKPGGRVAALAPGHTMHAGTRFGLPIAEECLACHTDRLPAREFPLNLLPDPSAWHATGISCAACHDRAEEHARWREEGSGAEDPIRTAPRSGKIESLSLCARCHLQGDASFLLEPGARGIVAPGGDLLAKRAVFVAASPTDEIGFVSQVERLVLARCFTESKGPEAMTCLTCHDPHRSSFDPEERARVRDACKQCHGAVEHPCSLPETKRGTSVCVDCHMRRTGVFDVATVEIHDHRIARDAGKPSPSAKLRAKEAVDGSLALFAWPGEPKPAYAEDPGLWMMALRSLGRADLAMTWVAREPGPVSAALPTYHHLRGSLLEEAGRSEEARAAYARALELDPEQAETAVNLGLLLGKLGKAREGIAVLDTVLARHPKAANALRNRAVLHHGLGDTEKFATDLEAAFAIARDAVLARTLADHHARAGRREIAESWRRAAHELDPAASGRR